MVIYPSPVLHICQTIAWPVLCPRRLGVCLRDDKPVKKVKTCVETKLSKRGLFFFEMSEYILVGTTFSLKSYCFLFIGQTFIRF